MHRRRPLLLTALLVLLFLLSIPLFFEIYRAAAFNTAPRDDYGPYLQRLVGQGGEFPGAPMNYRLLSVLAAVPFYFLMPTYSFSNLANIDPHYLRATEALAAVSYLSLLASAGVIFLICQKKLGATTKSSLVVALLSVFFSAFISQVGVDPIAIFVISLLLYLIDRPWLFSALLLLSVGINEKIVFLFAIIFALRLIFERDRTTVVRFGVAAVAAVGYFAIRLVVNAPGWESQMAPSSYLPTFVSMIPYMFSFKGLVTNLMPTLVIAALALLDLHTVNRLHIDSPVWRRSDSLVFVVVLMMGMAINIQYTVGRLVMFTYPLYLPMLSRRIDDWFPDAETRRTPVVEDP